MENLIWPMFTFGFQVENLMWGVKNLFIPGPPHMIDHWPGQTIERSAGMQQVVIISPQSCKKIEEKNIPLEKNPEKNI